MAFGKYRGAVPLFCRLIAAGLRRPRRHTLEQRLAMLPVSGAPVSQPVPIRWDEHQIPFIEAQSDDDLAAALGVVHAHLRLGQMELMRLIAKGRVAEIIGRVGLPIDRLLRTFDIGRAVPDIVLGLPPETRSWLEAFVRGINHCAANAPERPGEFALLGLKQKAWSIEDIVLLGRLIAADVNWIVWLRLFKFRTLPSWPELWRRLLCHDMLSFESGNDADDLARRIAGTTLRSGSNSCALAATHGENGGALIANDPHLSFMLPNAFLLAGMKSPSYHAVGMMVPGIPFIGIGRNTAIAWGGASLHAASSDLVAVPKGASLRTREERVAVRGEKDTILSIRESPWGPVVSDLSQLRNQEPLALRWMGHQRSDEFTAMLRANRARNWDEFRVAFEGYALPGLEMNCVEASGDIGQLMAAKLPQRENAEPADLVTQPGNGWETPITSADLPFRYRPAEGFLASANARPDDSSAIVGFHFSPPNRVRRLRELLAGHGSSSLSMLKAIQLDCHLSESLTQRDQILPLLRDTALSAREKQLAEALRNWNGDYDARSRGASAFELLVFHLARAIVPASRQVAYEAAWGTRALVWADIMAAPTKARADALGGAVARAARDFSKASAWGSRHHLRLAHPFGMIPIIGRRYRLDDIPVSGTSETLMKTAHGLTNKRHHARYGSVARHISDMSDPDANYFALLGGQDAWFGSPNFADQVALWRRGEYVRIPLTSAAVRERFTHSMVLTS